MQVFQATDSEGVVRTFEHSRCASNWWIKAYPEDPENIHVPQEVRLTQGECLYCYWCGQKAFDGDGRGCSLCGPDESCPNWNYSKTYFGDQLSVLLVYAFGGRTPDKAWTYALHLARHETTVPEEIVKLVLERRSEWESL